MEKNPLAVTLCKDAHFFSGSERNESFGSDFVQGSTLFLMDRYQSTAFPNLAHALPCSGDPGDRE